MRTMIDHAGDMGGMQGSHHRRWRLVHSLGVAEDQDHRRELSLRQPQPLSSLERGAHVWHQAEST